MDVAGSAVGIASLGIQVCQGLLSYYDGWKDYKSDIGETYKSIVDLSRTLTLLRETLEAGTLDHERSDRVKSCIVSCEDGLTKLSNKLQKLQSYGDPEGLRQKAWSELQRMWYPFRLNTLTKLRNVVSDVQERLKLAVQVLQLDLSSASQIGIASLQLRTDAIADSVNHVLVQNEQLLAAQQSDQLAKIKAWLSAPDPWINQTSARQRHEPDTGAWLLDSRYYQMWKSGTINHVWVHGKAGCGKTVVCSTAIEDIRVYCQSQPNTAYAFFYFSFSDNAKQSYDDLLRSLVVQFGWKQSSVSALQEAYEERGPRIPDLSELEKILLASVKAYDKIFLLLDALDESPEGNDVRQVTLNAIVKLARIAPNIRIFSTSRELRDVRESMETLKATTIVVSSGAVDTDIHTYVSKEVMRDQRLCRLDRKTQMLIEETLSRKADGMFRWVFCQLDELKKLKSSKPRYVEHVLNNLPPTLDVTYSRMLTGIDELFRAEALTLLRWITYAERPMTLGELAEASITDPAAKNSVDTSNRGDLEDTVNILSGLVVVQDVFSAEDLEDSGTTSDSPASEDLSTQVTLSQFRPQIHSEVRLAHFSVQEFLASNRVLESDTKYFYMDSASAHMFLAHSCVAYLTYYSADDQKLSTKQDLTTFPLLEYAAKSWYYHSELHGSANVDAEISLLTSNAARRNWLLVHQPDMELVAQFSHDTKDGSGFYYACCIGVEMVVLKMLQLGHDVNGKGGWRVNALEIALDRGHTLIVKLLLNAGANYSLHDEGIIDALHTNSMKSNVELVKILLDMGIDANTYDMLGCTALHGAAAKGSTDVVKLLLDRGANVNAQGGPYGNALQAASAKGWETIVEILLERGADVNAHGGRREYALLAACKIGNSAVVRTLLDHGADVNTRSAAYGTALYLASERGDAELAKLLIDRGADVNMTAGHFAHALGAASFYNRGEVVNMLLDRGADVNAQSATHGTALCLASERGYVGMVKLLVDRGANVDMTTGTFINALGIASLCNRGEVVKILLDQGANVNAEVESYGTALIGASLNGHQEVVRLLLDEGAQINAPCELFGTALIAASRRGHVEAVRMLVDAGADVDAHDSDSRTALSEARLDDHEEIVQILLAAGAHENATV